MPVRWLSLSEAALALGVQSATLRQQIARHALRARKVGSYWQVSDPEVERYREHHRRLASPATHRRPGDPPAV